ncbi:MAG: 2'-5' RNA ligase family protein, partial [Cyanobium sp. MAG_102]|nr:2'-5' RNA ligase family protein [Cyanobium sp. MAG_102]
MTITPSTAPMPLIAINVLLEPDAATVEKAKAINARLRENYPASFPLDANHAPHITILQLFIKTVDLGQVAAAIGNVLRSEPPINIEGKATGYFELASENLKLVGFHIEATPYQHQLQQKIIAATAPFAVKYGTSDAFAPRLDGEPISQATIDYVTNFGDTRTAPNYQPHLTLGIGTSDFVEALVAEPFETFSFQTASISLYQIGDYGVAQTKLYDLSCQVDPLPFQAAFAIDELKLRILTEPSLTSNPMVQAALDGDLAKLLEGEHFDGLMQILAITHAGMTVEEFRDAVQAWFRSASHPRYGKAYGELTYQPMQELLRYLRRRLYAGLGGTGLRHTTRASCWLNIAGCIRTAGRQTSWHQSVYRPQTCDLLWQQRWRS